MIYTLTFNPSIDYEMNLAHLSLSHTKKSTEYSFVFDSVCHRSISDVRIIYSLYY